MYQEAVNIRRRVHGGDRNVDIAEGFSNQVSYRTGYLFSL